MGTLNKGGIYGIINLCNNKVYVGKSKNIYNRWRDHKYKLRKHSKDCNRYLQASWDKHGSENFVVEILEEICGTQPETYYKERELFWMDYLNTCDRAFGYNLRRDSGTQMSVHPDTRKRMSESRKGSNNSNYGNYWTDSQKLQMSVIQKERYRAGAAVFNSEAAQKGIKNKLLSWERNPELKKKMAKRVSDTKSKYDILKIDKVTCEILEEFNTFMDLKEKYPDVGKTVVFSACNGNKKTYKGFIWRYRDKKTGEILTPPNRETIEPV